MKKVLIVANDFTTIHHFRMELLQRLQADGHEVVLALPEDEKNEAFRPLVTKLVSIPLSRFGTNPLADYKTYRALRGLIRAEQPEAVVTFTAKPNIYGGLAASKEKVPYFPTVTGLGKNFEDKNLISKIMVALQKAAFKNAKTVFFQNEKNREILQSHGIARDNSKMIPGSGVNLTMNRFEPLPENEKTVFLSAARIRQDKGYDELFAVIRRFRAEEIPAEFHVIGWYEDESYKATVEEMQEKFGVKFYDFIPHDQMHRYIADCDCLVQPSHHEGMSNVILEAAATGRPCIASDIHGCKEAVRDGETGYLFEVKNADDLYQKMKQFIHVDQDTRAQMGRNARQFMEQCFDRNTVVQAYIDEINR